MSADPGQRRAELVASLGAVRARIAEACESAGRDPRSVTMIAVTKTYPVEDIATLSELGVFDIGENRDQEAKAKSLALADLPLRWHFVGRVQTNKVASISRYATAVHSLDRREAVTAFAKATAGRGSEPLEAFVQVSLDGDTSRGGAPEGELLPLADEVAAAPGMLLRGVMAVPPIGADVDVAFAKLAQLSAAVRAEHPGADAISAGMSSDLETAVRHGSTHVRVGTALLGRRSASFS